MRLLFIILFFATTNKVYAQQPFPVGVANSFMLTDKDGYPGFNYSLYKQSKDGTSYALQYNNIFTISGNNYFQSFDTLQKLPGTIAGIKALDNNEAWVFGSHYVAVFKNNKLDTIIHFDFELYIMNEDFYSNAVLIFSKAADGLDTYLFDGKKMTHRGLTNQHIIQSSNWISMSETSGTWFSKKIKGGVELYQFNFNNNLFEYVKTIAHPDLEYISFLKDQNNALIISSSDFRKGYWYHNGKLQLAPFALSTGTGNMLRLSGVNQNNLYQIFIESGNNFYVSTFDSNGINKEIPFSLPGGATLVHSLPGGNFYIQTGNRSHRIFPALKKYPAIYNNNSASNIFSLKQDDKGSIWAGSYQGFLSLIDKDRILQLPEKRFGYMNGGSFYNGNMYLIGEGVGGLVQFDKQGKGRQVIPNTYTGYCTLVSRDQKYFYYGTSSGNGLWQTSTESLATLRPQWNKIDTAKGSRVQNILTIAEDSIGRIWYGAGRQAFAMYNPSAGKAITWEVAKNESPFAAFSSAVDKHGTVWIGSALKGLWYYSDYNKPATPASFERVMHPFLNGHKIISALTVYKDWLVIAATDKMLLLNIDSLYYRHKTIVRYLNPQEASFTAPTEQNTLITSNTDSTVWFSTSDMLYQWDINKWINAPVFKVNTNLVILTNEKEYSLQPQKQFYLEPGINSFEIQCRYVSPDNLPRYISAILVKNGDTVDMPEPAMESSFSFKNLAGGNYSFLLDVFESDGSITHYKYQIELKKFLWQQWWFWPFISLLLLFFFGYIIYSKRKRERAEQSIKLKESELLAYKNEQAKKLAKLQLVSLSSQFRPHFILNALNTIGAQMHDKPDTEIVLSRLGQSVNLIFNHSLQQKIAHSFTNEWQLVKNVIYIHQLMYLKKLQTQFPDAAMLEKIKSVEVPLGLIQIPVENALLHGLSNKETGPWILQISLTENQDYFFVQVTDNGVGRATAATLSNFTRHGTGTKNISEVLAIVNANNTRKITLQYSDDIYEEDGKKYGTSVTIEIPKQFEYDK